jgi:hypothetical protein
MFQTNIVMGNPNRKVTSLVVAHPIKHSTTTNPVAINRKARRVLKADLLPVIVAIKTRTSAATVVSSTIPWDRRPMAIAAQAREASRVRSHVASMDRRLQVLAVMANIIPRDHRQTEVVAPA